MDNREVILSRALSLFTLRGYDAVGVQEIAEAAGVTKPTLYHYFGNKRGLLDALLQERGRRFLESVYSAVSYTGDITATLTAIASAYFSFMTAEPEFFSMFLSMLGAPGESEAFRAVVALRDEQSRFLEDVFLKASGDHGNMKGRHVAFAASFLGTLQTYSWLSRNGRVTLDSHRIYEIIRQFMHGIFS